MTKEQTIINNFNIHYNKAMRHYEAHVIMDNYDIITRGRLWDVVKYLKLKGVI